MLSVSFCSIATQRPKRVRRGGGILDGVVDSVAAQRRHDVRRVADQQQAGAVPARQAVRFDRDQRALFPVVQLVEALGDPRHSRGERSLERLETVGVDLLVDTLGQHVADLPVIRALQHDQPSTHAEAAYYSLRVAVLAR